MTSTPATPPSDLVLPGPREGEVLELEVDGLGFGGAGLAHVEGILCRVPRTLPGERVRARVARRSRHTARMFLESVVHPSPQRVSAPCPLFATCGGCQLQHLPYERQLEAKSRTLRERLERALGEEVAAVVEPVVPAPSPLGYRVRSRFLVREGALAFGGLRGGAIPVAHCPLTIPSMALVVRTIQSWLRRTGVGGSSWLDAIRIAAADPPLIGLEGTDPDPVAQNGLLLALAGCSVQRWTPDGEVEHLSGPQRARLGLGAIELLISAGSFTQTNPQVATLLYDRAVRELDPQRDQEVLDLYCGTGGLALHLSQAASHVYGVDVDPRALADAVASQHHNGIANATFRAGKCERIARRLLLAGARFPLATLNPPRAGISPELPELLPRLGIGRLAYLSCSPATLVRDLPLLREVGFEVERVVPFDMFPQTYHLEVLAVLRLID